MTWHTVWITGSRLRKYGCFRIRRSFAFLVKETGSSESRAKKIENQKMLPTSPASNAIGAAPRWFSPPMGGPSLLPLGPRLDMTSRTFRSSFVVEAKKATRRENQTWRHTRIRKKVCIAAKPLDPDKSESFFPACFIFFLRDARYLFDTFSKRFCCYKNTSN